MDTNNDQVESTVSATTASSNSTSHDVPLTNLTTNPFVMTCSTPISNPIVVPFCPLPLNLFVSPFPVVPVPTITSPFVPSFGSGVFPSSFPLTVPILSTPVFPNVSDPLSVPILSTPVIPNVSDHLPRVTCFNIAYSSDSEYFVSFSQNGSRSSSCEPRT